MVSTAYTTTTSCFALVIFCASSTLLFLPLASSFSSTRPPQLLHVRSHEKMQTQTQQIPTQTNTATTNTLLNLFWFSGKKGNKNNNDASITNNKRDTSSKNSNGDDADDDDYLDAKKSLTSDNMSKKVGTVMESMNNLKRTQKVGKMTDNLVQELSAVTIEGTAAAGNVKVFFNGQQQPTGVDISESYLSSGIGADDLNAALTTAMKDGYEKSSKKMDEKMKPFFTELGLPPSSS